MSCCLKLLPESRRRRCLDNITYFLVSSLHRDFPSPCALLIPPVYLHSVARSPLADLALAKFPQFSDSRRLTRHHTLNHLNRASNHVLTCDLVCNGRGLNFDDTDSWIFITTVMCAVAEITKPGFQGRRVVLLDRGAVGEDARFAGDRSPLAEAVEEGDVDGVVRGDVVGLA